MQEDSECKEGKQEIINFYINITLRPVIKGKEKHRRKYVL